MTSRHDVMTSCKPKNDNIFELGKPENYRNKKRIISLALLQTEIEYRLFWCHDMTSWRDVIIQIQNWQHFRTQQPKVSYKQKKNHLSSTSTSWDRENKFGCVMLWRHDVTVSRGSVKSKSLNCILWMGPGAMENRPQKHQTRHKNHVSKWSTSWGITNPILDAILDTILDFR